MNDTPMSISQANGSCLCGAITFTLQFPSKWIVHCHCTRCQRAHGSAFVTWVGADTEQVQIDDPDKRLTWYQEPSGSSRGFCMRCGSPMFFRSLRDAGETHMTMALFTDALDRPPGSHEHYDTHVRWVTVAEKLLVEPDS
jgi:hypothetical protein